MFAFLFLRGVFADMSEYHESLYHVFKYFEFLAYFILAFVIIQLISFIIFLASLVSEPQQQPQGDVVHPIEK